MINNETIYEEGFQAGRDSRDPEIESLKRRIAEINKERNEFRFEVQEKSRMLNRILDAVDSHLFNEKKVVRPGKGFPGPEYQTEGWKQ